MAKKITELAALTTADVADLLALVDVSASTTKKITVAGLAEAIRLSMPASTPIQVVSSASSAVATGTGVIPLDDTIPQNTEGTEFITLAITPTSATNKLVIEAVIFGSHNQTAADTVAALFQDATANALAAMSQTQPTADGRVNLVLRHVMDAGTTSATTFKIRVGGHIAGTFTLNGNTGARLFGAITKSSLTIMEYRV